MRACVRACVRAREGDTTKTKDDDSYLEKRGMGGEEQGEGGGDGSSENV